jgi:hypothetical protein
MWLGQKVMIRFNFDPLARGGKDRLFTYDGPFVYDGPESQEQATRRQRQDFARNRVRKALGKAESKWVEALAYVQKELEMDDEEFEFLVEDEKALKASRKRKK